MQKSYFKIIMFTLFSFSFMSASTAYFGKLGVTSMIDNLSITIDEEPIGVLNKNKKFIYEFKTLKGSGDFDQGYKTTFERIKVRTKPEVLLKKSGLIEEIKLQHNSSYFMTKDKENIYILTKGSSILYEKSKLEEDAEYLEVYDLKTLKLKSYIKIGENKTTFGLYSSVHVDENNLYLGTYEGYVLFFPKRKRFKV